MSTVDFPDGTLVWARGLHDRSPEPPPELGLYLDPAWQPPWPATFLLWPDRGTPTDSRTAATAIRRAFAEAHAGRRLEVGCAGGIGRTGTVLACMAVLAGVPVGESVDWVRDGYHPDRGRD